MDQQSEGHGVTPIDLSVILGEPQPLVVMGTARTAVKAAPAMSLTA
jgi:hypothetical protein